MHFFEVFVALVDLCLFKRRLFRKTHLFRLTVCAEQAAAVTPGLSFAHQLQGLEGAVHPDWALDLGIDGARFSHKKITQE